MSLTPDSPSSGAQPCRGLSFDDFHLGRKIWSPARTLTEADIAQYAGLSGDYNPLHTDAVYCASTPFRQRVAHGLLVQSIASGLGWQTLIFEGTIAALTEVCMRFEKPAFAGDTLQLELEVLELDPAPGPRRGWVKLGTRVRNQKGEQLLDGHWRVLVHRRRPPAQHLLPD